MTPSPPNDRPDSNSRRPVTEIKVTLSTRNDAVTVTVDPWEAPVKPGTSIEWTVDGADAIRIEPKDPGKWPFPGPPAPGNPGLPAKAGKVIQGLPNGKKYPYSILLTAGGRTIDIDPEVVIFDPF